MASKVSSETYGRCKSLCQKYLHGSSWSRISGEQDMQVTTICGGLSNTIYMCKLSEQLTEDGVPQRVLVRFYGKILLEQPYAMLTDTVVYALLSERSVGPKLHGIFREGRIEEFVENKKLSRVDLHSEEISDECARILANLHKLKMPLEKIPTLLSEILQRYIQEAINNRPDATVKEPEDEALLKCIFKYDLVNEYEELLKILDNVDSKVVFCHNDLQEGNILLLPSSNKMTLVPIDFEYSGYNYRGYDLANHFCEWIYDYNVQTPPYFLEEIADFPSEQQQRRFLQAYLTEMEGSCTSQGVDKLLKEVRLFTMASHFFWAIWAVVQHQISDINFGYLSYALARLRTYQALKNDFNSG